MHAVRLISEPPFYVNFRQESPRLGFRASVCHKVTVVAKNVFDLIKVLAVAAKETAVTNLKTMWPTFKRFVLGYDGTRFNMSDDATWLLIKASLWVVGHTVGYIFMTTIAAHRLYKALPSYLLGIVPDGINIAHLKAQKTKIETAHIPPTIRVSTLLSVFDTINFTNPDGPGYMPPSVRREDGLEYSVHQLRSYLNTFIHRVEGRVAFLGTPPSYMAPQLLCFYQKIEDATRFSLHKVIKEYDDFMRAHQGVIPANGTPDYKEYCDLLENKARVAIDMAIAGAHCGARYMGDAIDTYMGLQNNGLGAVQNLETRLWTLLANRREMIARGDIQRHLGRDTHAFSAYMANMGGVLGLPGAENVVEYLTGSSFDRERFLRLFFRNYTPEDIRETVQREIQSSQSFREVLFDWLKVQNKDWKKEVYKSKVKTILQEIKQESEQIHFNKISQFLELVKELHAKGVLPEMNDSWSEYLDDLFNLDDSRAYFERIFAGVDKISLLRAKNDLKQILQNVRFEADVKQVIAALQAKNPLDLTHLKSTCDTQDKIYKINEAIAKAEFPTLDEAVLFRAITGKTRLQTVIEDYVDRMRREEFLQALIKVNDDEDPEQTLARVGVKRDVLNWILYSHGILKPV